MTGLGFEWVDDGPVRRNFDEVDKKLGAVAQVAVFVGTGSPNTVVTASPGALYINLSGGASTTLYVKESGSATNTGWVGK